MSLINRIKRNPVLPINGRDATDHTIGQITQRDLVEERILREQYRESRELYYAKRAFIRRALRNGTPIETGARKARIHVREVLIIE